MIFPNFLEQTIQYWWIRRSFFSQHSEKGSIILRANMCVFGMKSAIFIKKNDLPEMK